MPRLASVFEGRQRQSEGPSAGDAVEFGTAKYKILFVDDEENVLNVMKRIFRKEKYALLTASSGQEALECLQQNQVHIVISDHRMPAMTGAELLRKIKTLYPQTIRIMLTGHADINAIMGAINEGAVYKFITKPWNDQDLRLTVKLALEQYELVEENKALKKKEAAQTKKIRQLSRFVDVNRSQVGRILLSKELIRQRDLDKALAIQARNNMVLPAVLIEMGAVEEKTLFKAIKSELGINRVYPNEFTVPDALASLVPREICEKSLLVPLKQADGKLIVAMADPTDLVKVDDLKFITGFAIQPVLAAQEEITDKLREVYGGDNVLESRVAEINMSDSEKTKEITIDEDDEADINLLVRVKEQPAIKIVNAVVSDALVHGASDVHIEPKRDYVMIRYRVDGLLYDKIHIPLAMHRSIVSRIKVMSGLDISERRKPQDGRVTVVTSSRMIDMRISTLPTINGEKVVLRLLDRNAAIREVRDLGLSEAGLAKISRLIAQPQGILLSTGPAGSGKTSTLYSLLQKHATISKNYTTIEDPVEYYMDMAEQVHIHEKIGVGFSVVLKALLRQDPNVIMLGEIRDYETAEVAFHAALTGHLVLSTLHTNGSVASITRLRDIGLKPYVISEALIGIVAQRLVRRVCPECKADDDTPKAVLHALKLDDNRLDFAPQKGAGCEHCDYTGYSGRIGIFEVFQIDGELRKMIHRGGTETELVKAALWGGMKTLADDAIEKVRTGVTTCEEVLRVLGPQNTLEFECPQCGVYLEERFQYCPLCGGAIVPRCAKCAKLLASNWKACPYCGKKVEEDGERHKA